MDKFYTFYNKEKWNKAKKILKQLIDENPDDDFLWTSLSSVTYELRKYKKALQYSKKAFELNSNSPLVLWDYASVLYVSDRDEEAREKWKKIIDYGEEKVAFLTKQGLRSAKVLVNDSRFRLGQSYFYEGNDLKAKKYFEEYMNNRKKGMTSLYKKGKVIQYLKEIEESIAIKN